MSRSLKGTDDDAGVNDESADLKCVLCEKSGMQQLSEEIVLSNFPLDINLCRSWVKNVGIKELVHLPIRELNASMYLCQKHFHPKCYVKKRNSIFLIAEAVPTEELYYRMLPENIMADFPKEQSQTKSSGKTLKNEDSDTIELYKCIICKGNSKPGQSKLLSRFPVEPDLSGSRRPRVTLSQLETMLAFLEDHKDVACGYNKSAVDRGCHRRHWKSITQCLNSQKDGGACKDWKGWSAYFTDYKSKIKKKVQRQKALNEIENRFFLMLKRAFAESLTSSQKRNSSQGQGTGDDSLESSSDDGRRPDQWPRLSNLERREHWLEKYGPEDLPKPTPVFNPEPKCDYRLEHNESDELPSESNSVQRHRVSLSQLELIWEFLDSHRALVVNRLNTSHLRGCSRIMWISITPRLNSEDGATKVWKEWAKYWADYRYKIQKQVEKNLPLNDIEHKFWTLIMNVNDEYANSNGGNVGVQPYPSSSQTTGFSEDPLGDSSDSEEETKSEPVKPEMLVEILMPVEPASAEVEEVTPAPTEVAPDPAEVEEAAPAPVEVASAKKQPAPSPRQPRRRPLRRRPFLTREAGRRYMIAIERERNNILRGFLGRIADTLDRVAQSRSSTD